MVKKYNIIARTRETKLLTVLAESGLIEALEGKGLTLSKFEKLLPIVDDLNLLELVVKNKDLIVKLAPLLIEPAPALLPVAKSVLKTSPSTFSSVGIGLLGAGLFEGINDNFLLGFLGLALGLPLTAIGALLNAINFQNLPSPSLKVPSESSSPTPRPVLKKATTTVVRPVTATKPVTPVQQKPITPQRVVAATARTSPIQREATGGTRRRKTVKVN